MYKFLKIIKNIFLYIIIQGIVLAFLSFVLVFYGSLENIKETWVLTAMTTMNHQYLAKWFVSENEINKIIAKNQAPTSSDKTNLSAIEIDTEVINEKLVSEDKYTNSDAKVIYNDNGIRVESITGSKFKGYVSIIRDPSRVKVGTTAYLRKNGERLQDMTSRYGAILGINAGGFEDSGGHGTGGTPLGFVIEDGITKYTESGDEFPVVGFNKDNILVIGNYSKEEINRLNLRDAITFNPFLIINGTPQITSGNGGWGIQPRTAIGQRKDGTVLFITIDGRQTSSIGATLKEVQDIMLKYGAYNCANLDGGASTQLVLNKKTLNSPSSSAGPRRMSTSFIVK